MAIKWYTVRYSDGDCEDLDEVGLIKLIPADAMHKIKERKLADLEARARGKVAPLFPVDGYAR